MKNSIVLELQKEAYNDKSSISTLIRKSYVVAKKLQICEFEKWLNSEMNGYNCRDEEIPDYRQITCELKAFNPFRGWIPTIMDNTQIAELINIQKIRDPITNLENLSKAHSQYITLRINNERRKLLSDWFGFDTKYELFISRTQLESIIESVRNIVLNWSLKLEEDGIMGEGMTFNDKEKSIARKKNYTENHFHGPVISSQFQQNSQHSTQVMNNQDMNIEKLNELIQMFKENIGQVKLQPLDKKEIETQIQTVEEQAKLPNPNKAIIFECLRTVRNILEGVAGGIFASGLIYELGLFIQK
ncbi:hypothetical protein ACJDU8_01020 [Clostridium sp. WILCCON 0269]|uniref:AbiTii domain-containing protein n=1 Tax=Candidatus Clostridium eludens TaxID=3381663 RepID=A0ABW8SFS8_9CLOT